MNRTITLTAEEAREVEEALVAHARMLREAPRDYHRTDEAGRTSVYQREVIRQFAIRDTLAALEKVRSA